MRKIASFADSAAATKFRWFLQGHRIMCEQAGGITDAEDVWIVSDDDWRQAKELLISYRAAPEAAATAQIIAAGKQAPAIPADPQPEVLGRKRRPSLAPTLLGPTPVTVALIAITVIIYILGQLGGRGPVVAGFLRFSQFAGTNFYELKAGQIWRLITPMFLHEGLLHIFFNMVWLWLLGRQIEINEGSRRLLILVVAAAVFSHLVFYLLVGPNFGGMSGVNYALVSYSWFMSEWGGQNFYRREDNQGQFFLIWYILSLILSLVGMHIANTIHGVGALAGLAFAVLRSRKYRQILRQPNHHKPLAKQAGIGLLLLMAGMIVDRLM